MTSLVASLALLAAVACAAAGRLVAPRRLSPPRPRRVRTRPATTESLCELLDEMAAEVRTGSSLTTALRHVASARPAAVSTLGVPLSLPLDAPPCASPDMAVVVHSVNAAHALGGPVAATLDHASAVLRERDALRSEALAHAAQARLSARVLTAVPLVFAGWSATTNSSFRSALLHPAGATGACVGAALNVAGWCWMRAIVGRATP